MPRRASQVGLFAAITATIPANLMATDRAALDSRRVASDSNLTGLDAFEGPHIERQVAPLLGIPEVEGEGVSDPRRVTALPNEVDLAMFEVVGAI